MFIYINYLILGAIAGLSSGLLGIAGGIFIIPGLMALLPHAGLPANMVVHAATASSIAATFFITAKTVYHQNIADNIIRPVVKHLLPSILLGTIIGTFINQRVSASTLQHWLGSFLLVIAMLMLLPEKSQQSNPPKKEGIPQTLWMQPFILFIGTQIGLLGIGGGLLIIPFLTYFHIPIRRAIGTSALCVLCASGIALIMHVFHHTEKISTPYTFGGIYWPAAILVSLGSILSVPWGVKLSGQINERYLKNIFCLFLLGIGSHLLWTTR